MANPTHNPTEQVSSRQVESAGDPFHITQSIYANPGKKTIGGRRETNVIVTRRPQSVGLPSEE